MHPMRIRGVEGLRGAGTSEPRLATGLSELPCAQLDAWIQPWAAIEQPLSSPVPDSQSRSDGTVIKPAMTSLPDPRPQTTHFHTPRRSTRAKCSKRAQGVIKRLKLQLIQVVVRSFDAGVRSSSHH